MIAPVDQSVSALSTFCDLSNRFHGYGLGRTAVAANARAEYGRFFVADGSPKALTAHEPEMAEK